MNRTKLIAALMASAIAASTLATPADAFGIIIRFGGFPRFHTRHHVVRSHHNSTRHVETRRHRAAERRVEPTRVEPTRVEPTRVEPLKIEPKEQLSNNPYYRPSSEHGPSAD